MCTDEYFAIEGHHSHFSASNHEKVPGDAIVGCIRLKDQGRCILQELELFTIRDGLLPELPLYTFKAIWQRQSVSYRQDINLL